MIQITALSNAVLASRIVAILLFLIIHNIAVAIPIEFEPFIGDTTMRSLLEQKQFEQVREMAEERLRNAPDDGEMLSILGFAQAGLGDLENAEQNVLRAIELVPDDNRDDLRLLLAEILVALDDAPEAERVLQEVIGRQPTNVRALLATGYFYSRTGDVVRAIDYYDRVLRIDPQQETALKALLQVNVARGNYAEVARIARQIPADSPAKGLGYYFEALALMRQPQPDNDAAVELLEKALVAAEPNPQTHFTLGYVLLKEQRLQEAVGQLTEAVSLDPDFFAAHKLLGQVWLQLNQPQLAVIHLESALEIEESSELQHLLAQAYMQQGRNEEGLAQLVAALDDQSQPPGKQSALEGLYRYSSGEYEQSEQELRQALRETPDADHVRFLLISTLLKQQRFEAAALEAEFAMSVLPGQRDVLLNLLGLAKLGSGAFAEAEEALREAHALDIGAKTTRINLSNLYFRTGQYAKAEKELTAILAQDPADLESRVRLSRVFQAANNYINAERVLLDTVDNTANVGPLTRELIRLKLRERDYESALNYASAMIEQYPGSFEGFALRAQALASMGREIDAVEALDAGFEAAGLSQGALAAAAGLARTNGWHSRAVDYLQTYDAQFGLVDPKLTMLYAIELIEVGQTVEARKIINASLKSTDADAFLLLAKSYIADGDQVRAEENIDAALSAGVPPSVIDEYRAELGIAIRIAALKESLASNSDQPGNYVQLASAYETVGDFDAAIAVYEDAIRHGDSDLLLQTQIARLHLKNGHGQQAIKIANNVIENPKAGPDVRSRAYAVVGMSRVLQRESDKAEQALTRAIDEGSRLATAHYELAKIKSRKGETATAVKLLREAIDLEPQSLENYLALAALHNRDRNIQEIIAVYEKGLTENPESIALLNNLALVYMSQGANDKAIPLAHEASRLAPDDARSLNTLGRVYFQSNDNEQALRYLEQAVEKNPNSPLYRYHLGMAYFEVGALDQAKHQLQDALDRQFNAAWESNAISLLKAMGKT